MQEASRPKNYRLNVAVIVLNDHGKMLACHRADIPGVWQIPQGGVEAGESPESAMYRELEEEIGTRDVILLGKLSKPIRYDWPEELYSRGYLGQEQMYYVVRIKRNVEINFQRSGHHPEFDAFEWITWKEFLSRITGFKVQPYSEAIAAVRQELPGLLTDR